MMNILESLLSVFLATTVCVVYWSVLLSPDKKIWFFRPDF